jgi:hypothetical protein
MERTIEKILNRKKRVVKSVLRNEMKIAMAITCDDDGENGHMLGFKKGVKKIKQGMVNFF